MFFRLCHLFEPKRLNKTAGTLFDIRIERVIQSILKYCRQDTSASFADMQSMQFVFIGAEILQFIRVPLTA